MHGDHGTPRSRRIQPPRRRPGSRCGGARSSKIPQHGSSRGRGTERSGRPVGLPSSIIEKNVAASPTAIRMIPLRRSDHTVGGAAGAPARTRASPAGGRRRRGGRRTAADATASMAVGRRHDPFSASFSIVSFGMRVLRILYQISSTMISSGMRNTSSTARNTSPASHGASCTKCSNESYSRSRAEALMRMRLPPFWTVMPWWSIVTSRSASRRLGVARRPHPAHRRRDCGRRDRRRRVGGGTATARARLSRRRLAGALRLFAAGLPAGRGVSAWTRTIAARREHRRRVRRQGARRAPRRMRRREPAGGVACRIANCAGPAWMLPRVRAGIGCGGTAPPDSAVAGLVRGVAARWRCMQPMLSSPPIPLRGAPRSCRRHERAWTTGAPHFPVDGRRFILSASAARRLTQAVSQPASMLLRCARVALLPCALACSAWPGVPPRTPTPSR